MDVSMTVRRLDLIEALKKARDEFLSKSGPVVQPTERRQKSFEAMEAFKAEMIAALKKQAKGLKDGSAIVSMIGHGGQAVVVHADRPLQAKPYAPAPKITNDIVYAMNEARNADRFAHQIKSAARPYDAAIQLLEMSDDEHVGVPAAQYQALLAGRPIGAVDDDTDDF